MEIALAKAIAKAPAAMDAVIAVMDRPQRGDITRLAAARLVLEIAGVGAAAADQRHEELLAALRGKLSEAAYEEVVRTLAAAQGQRSVGAAADDSGDGTLN